MSFVNHAGVVVVSLTLAFTTGCAMLRAGSHRTATAKSARDVAACEKMCEVAGNAESNTAAVAKCKKDCQD